MAAAASDYPVRRDLPPPLHPDTATSCDPTPGECWDYTATVAEVLPESSALCLSRGGGSTALEYASATSGPSIVDLLVDHLVDLHSDSDEARSASWAALVASIQHGNSEALRILLELHRADSNCYESDKWSPLLFTAIPTGSTTVVRILLEYGAQASFSAAAGNTPEHAPAAAGDVGILKVSFCFCLESVPEAATNGVVV